MSQFGILERLKSEGQAISLESNPYSRYNDGEPISIRPGSEWAIKHFGYAWQSVQCGSTKMARAERIMIVLYIAQTIAVSWLRRQLDSAQIYALEVMLSVLTAKVHLSSSKMVP
jgi:hypothetical protein